MKNTNYNLLELSLFFVCFRVKFTIVIICYIFDVIPDANDMTWVLYIYF